MMPGSSFNVLQTIEPLLQYSFCLENGIKYDKYSVKYYSPSSSTYQRLLRDQTGLTIFQAIELLKINLNVYITCDKAAFDKQGKQSALFPKILSWYKPVTETIEDFIIDVDPVGAKSSSAAVAILHSLNRIVEMSNYTLKLTLMGVYTDSGGGGTLEPLIKELKNHW